MSTEVEEARQLLSVATFPGIRKLLEKHIESLEKATEKAAEPESRPLPSPVVNEETSVKPPQPSVVPIRKPVYSGVTFVPIEDFAWDQGGYNSPIVSVFVDLEGVGDVKDSVEFSSTPTSFDLRVTGLAGKNYRLIKDNLDKDIVPSESKIVVKKNKVVIKLQKKKGEYSYDHWTTLTSKKKRDSEVEKKKKDDPTSSLMDMMKDMYDDGDENMKKIIGEAMMKSRSGEKPTAPSLDDV